MVKASDKARILLVDDEPRLIHLVREVLGATGYEVLTAYSGEHAIEMVALEQPALILLDITLSGAMDGYIVARRIREFSNVPIIMLTAKVRESDKLHGFDVGADDYITKPFSSKELLARDPGGTKALTRKSTGKFSNRDRLRRSEDRSGQPPDTYRQSRYPPHSY